MHDKEKVELGIKACWSEYFSHKCFDCPYMQDRNDKKCVERLGADALALLKKQEPKQVEAEVINEIDRLYRCPSCHISMILRKQPYCHFCGQAVKWE